MHETAYIIAATTIGVPADITVYITKNKEAWDKLVRSTSYLDPDYIGAMSHIALGFMAFRGDIRLTRQGVLTIVAHEYAHMLTKSPEHDETFYKCLEGLGCKVWGDYNERGYRYESFRDEKKIKTYLSYCGMKNHDRRRKLIAESSYRILEYNETENPIQSNS